jgi:hypothetical protein
MPSIADAAAHLHAAGLPILFLDTCSIVDIIREPLRPDKLAGCVAAGVELLQLATSTPTRCSLVVGSSVPREWLNHAQATADDLRNHLARLDDLASSFHETCTSLGIALPFGRPTYGGLGLVNRLYDLSKQLLDASLYLDAYNDTNMRAFARAATNTPPSRKGGEIKDSTIVEECLEVCRQLHAGGFGEKRIFCTSNTNDYCGPGGALHPALTGDFAAVGLHFVTNLPWAVHEVKS